MQKSFEQLLHQLANRVTECMHQEMAGSVR